jgi:hypothetical protein
LRLDDNIKFKVKDEILKLSEIQYDCIDSNLIRLKRIKLSYCEKCKRIHEHQNPYIVVKKKDSIYHFEFFCGRNYIGHLKFQVENLII